MSEPIQSMMRATPSLVLIGTLGLIALISGVLVVSVFEYTAPFIAENHRVALEKAVLEVIPGAVSRREFTLSDRGVEEGATASGIRIHAGYDAEGRLLAVASEASAHGYADRVRGLYAYDPGCECIVGFKVLETKETPGIGDKIMFDERFIANFRSLDARLDEGGRGLANAIVTVRSGTKRNPWEIDAISGATISSRAVGRLLNDGAGAMLPRLVPHLDRIRNPDR